MKRFVFPLLVSSFIFLNICCTKENNALSTNIKEDPNSFFTAIFNGKTLKTSGYIKTDFGITDDINLNRLYLFPSLSTSNFGSNTITHFTISIEGSKINISRNLYQIPVQQLDASIDLERNRNAIGTYKLRELGSFYLASITDLTVGNKVYDLDPLTTIFTVTSADASSIQGTYTGNLIDGTSKVPVTGSYKLRKN